MSKFSNVINEYFNAWGDNNPKKQVWYYGKYVSIKNLYGYDDYVYYRPRRSTAGALVILGGLGLVGATGVGLLEVAHILKLNMMNKLLKKRRTVLKNKNFTQ